jgi:hypothetical protein
MNRIRIQLSAIGLLIAFVNFLRVSTPQAVAKRPIPPAPRPATELPEPPLPLSIVPRGSDERILVLPTPLPNRLSALSRTAGEENDPASFRVSVTKKDTVASPGSLETFFTKKVDPWFRRSTGWQFYNPDRLDRGQECARTSQFAFAGGIRYRFSF